jgi:competence protein ComFC
MIEYISVPPSLSLNPIYLDQVMTGCDYSAVVRLLVKEMKYKQVREVGKICAQILYYHTAIPGPIDLIVPVPLHSSRQAERGFNQAAIIAEELSRLLGTPTMPLLAKVRTTPTQASQHDRQLRLDNLTDAFALDGALLKSKFFTQQFANQTCDRVLLVDDVLTTGSTLNECARVLKMAGVAQVDAVTFAHGT